jgi:hypothetical protein
MSNSSVYLETTVVSYLTALPSRDLVVAGHQQVTREWWEGRLRFDLYISEAVLAEAGRGDEGAAGRRLAALGDVTVISALPEAMALARGFLEAAAMPRKAAIDAVHVAIAAVHGIDYLLTWNCAHIANAAIRAKVEAVCRAAGYQPPIICTPLELMDEEE